MDLIMKRTFLILLLCSLPCKTDSWESFDKLIKWFKGDTLNTLKKDVPLDKSRVKRQSGGGDESSDPNIVKTSSLPMMPDGKTINVREMPTLANGHIGATVYGPHVFLNGVYNGDQRTSHRAAIPALVMTRVELTPEVERSAVRRYYLNAETAVFTEEIDCEFAYIWHHTYVHAKYIRLLVTDIYALRKPGRTNGGVIGLKYPPLNSTNDIHWGQIRYEDGRTYVNGQTKVTEPGTSAPSNVYVYFHETVDSIALRGSTQFKNETMVLAIDRTDAAARKEFDQANQILSTPDSDGVYRGHYNLLKEHINTWRKTWYTGRVEIDGDPSIDKIGRFSQFYILSSLPSRNAENPPQISDVFVGASRSSLAKGWAGSDNMGHVFWDSEVYILPAVMLFHPNVTKYMLRYRSVTLPQAEIYADQLGYSGARYPFRSAVSGSPLDPDGCRECNQRKHHVNGAISYGIRMYYSVTRDRDFLTNPDWRACDITKSVAQFYAGIAKYNSSKGRYDISGVTGPDDSHPNVWNNAYTNVVASLAIHWARYMSCLCGRTSREDVPDDWMQIALYLQLPYDTVRRLHYQHEGFERDVNQNVKQADTILLGWPLNWNMSHEIWRNDLEFYEPLTSHRTPAMTHSFFTVGWKWIGEDNKAGSSFLKSYTDYLKKPFNIWSEYIEDSSTPQDERAVNFLPGMGGFLQSLIYGFAGVRVRPEMIEFHNPTPPPQCSGLRLIGFQYLGTNMTIEIRSDLTTIQVNSVFNRDFPLVLQRNTSYGRDTNLEPLEPGTRIEISNPRNGFFIYSTRGTECEHPRDYIYMPWGYSPWINKATSVQLSFYTYLFLLSLCVFTKDLCS